MGTAARRCHAADRPVDHRAPPDPRRAAGARPAGGRRGRGCGAHRGRAGPRARGRARDDGGGRCRQSRADGSGRAAAGRHRRAARPRRGAVRRPGDGQPRWRHGRGPAGHARQARDDARRPRLRDPLVDGDRRRRPRRPGSPAAPRRPRRWRRPRPAGQPDQAAHAVPWPDRERLHEDARRRLRQAAGRGPVPLERRRRDARPAAGGRRRAPRHGPRCSAGWRRSSRLLETSWRCVR